MWPFPPNRFEKVVAVEHDDRRDAFVHFRRTSANTIEETIVNSRHYFVVDNLFLAPTSSEYEVLTLEGSLPLRYLILCNSSATYRAALRAAQDRARAMYGDNALDHMWSRPLVEAYLMRSGTTLFSSLAPQDLKVVALDLEMYTSGGKFFADAEDKHDAIILATMADNRGKSLLLDSSTAGEAQLIRDICSFIREEDYDVICGHNLVGFDLPYLTTRAKLHQIPLNLGRDNSALKQRAHKRRYALREAPEYTIFGRHIIDTLPLLIGWDVTHRTLESYQLKEAVVALRLTENDRTDFDRSKISDLWDSDREKLRQYARDDAFDSLRLYNFLSAPTFYQTQFLPLTYQQCASTGTGTKVDICMIRAYLQKAHSLPLRGALIEGQGKGGLTDAKSLGWHRGVHKADVASLYPSICLTYGIKPRTDILEAFPAVLQHLTEQRLKAKAELKNLDTNSYEYNAVDALQNSLKILINSFYGMLGTSGLYFSDSEASNQITTTGQQILLQMVDNVEQHGGKVIEIDTDGIYFSLPGCGQPDTHISTLVAKGLALGIRVDYDGYYDYMYSYAPKNYVLVQGIKLIRKGVVFRSRRLFGLQEEFISTCVRLLSEDNILELAEFYRSLARRIRNKDMARGEVSTYMTVDQELKDYEKSQGQRSRPYELILGRPDRAKWTLRSKIHYYHAANGQLKLSEEFDGDIDVPHYAEAGSIELWSFTPSLALGVLDEYERVLKGDFQLRLF